MEPPEDLLGRLVRGRGRSDWGVWLQEEGVTRDGEAERGTKTRPDTGARPCAQSSAWRSTPGAGSAGPWRVRPRELYWKKQRGGSLVSRAGKAGRVHRALRSRLPEETAHRLFQGGAAPCSCGPLPSTDTGIWGPSPGAQGSCLSRAGDPPLAGDGAGPATLGYTCCDPHVSYWRRDTHGRQLRSTGTVLPTPGQGP